MAFRLAASALSLALTWGAAAQTPALLADGRSDDPAADVSTWSASPPMRQAVDAARAYWRGQDPSYEEDVRYFDVAEGAFTAPGTQQQAVLYFMSPWPRCCPKMGLAFVEDDRLVYHVAFEGVAQTLTAVPDLDGDGRDELVATGEFGMGGQVSRGMTVMAFGTDGLRDWGTAPVFDSACAAGPGDGGSTAARISAVPGPSFTVERFVQRSCEDTAWEADGDAEPLTLDPPSDVRYVALPLPSDSGTSGVSHGDRQVLGRLEAGDETLTSGEFFDEYPLEGRRGQMVVIDLLASAFDPYLILALPDGEQIDNDDHEGDRTRSLIETTLAEDGAYRVIVTSYQPGEVGAYELTIRVGGGE